MNKEDITKAIKEIITIFDGIDTKKYDLKKELDTLKTSIIEEKSKEK